MPRPRLVDSVTVVGESEPRYRAQSQPWRTVMQPRSADELKLLMMGVTRYGTARKSFRVIKQTDRFKALEYGGKTGSLDKDGVGRVDWFVGFARDPYNPARRIAAAVVTVHGPNWTVHSSYIAAELFRSYFKEL
jgi:cell division protein FtsI/penicillin-binding protein 2